MVPFQLVDAFTREPFAGNPAGVVVLREDHLAAGTVDPDWAQLVAAEIRASETAFVHPEGDGWRLRWWTPRTEVQLCGHATLACAHVLAARGELPSGGTLGFATRSGELLAHRDENGLLTLDLPAWPLADAEPPRHAVTELLGGVNGRYLGRTRVRQANDVIEVTDLAALDAVEIDRGVVGELGSHGLIVTCRTDDGRDGASAAMRYFAPALGVDEDPVTGSAACTIAPLWADRLGITELRIVQRSTRGGILHCRVDGDRVEVGGHAVTVVEGAITGPPMCAG